MGPGLRREAGWLPARLAAGAGSSIISRDSFRFHVRALHARERGRRFGRHARTAAVREELSGRKFSKLQFPRALIPKRGCGLRGKASRGPMADRPAIFTSFFRSKSILALSGGMRIFIARFR